jgi:hypothetical protein
MSHLDESEVQTLKVTEVAKRLLLPHRTYIRGVVVTGRVHIRWDAST